MPLASDLAGAEQIVCDYIETLTDHDTADDVVLTKPDWRQPGCRLLR
jgi:hypothetical protein